MTAQSDPNIPTPDNSAEQIRAALHQGRKIEAIKIYRGQSGAGLKEAKDAIDPLEADLRTSEPEKFSTRKAGGCSAVMVALVILASAIGIGSLLSNS